MLQNALVTTLRVGVAATNEVAHIVVDNTLGRFLNTNPDKVRERSRRDPGVGSALPEVMSTARASTSARTAADVA